MIIPSSLSELRSFGLYALRRKMYSPHLKPLNTLNQTQKRGILRQGRALNNLRRLRQSTASTGLLKRVTLSGEALLCDFFRDGRLPVGGSRGHREGLSVSTQHMRCAEGLRLPRRGLKMPLRYQKSAPCPQAYTHTGTMGRHKKLHILSILSSIKTNWRKCHTIKKEHLRILRPLKKARGLSRYQDPIQTPQACPPQHSAQ